MRRRLFAGLLAVAVVAAGLTIAWIGVPEGTVAVQPISANAQSTNGTTAAVDQSITDSGQSAVKNAIAAVGPAVVRVDVTGTVSVTDPMMDFFNDPFFQRFFGNPDGNNQQRLRQQQSVGSGVVISYGGEKLVLTNAHVVDSADSIVLTNTAGEQWDATILGSDELLDVAVLRIEGDTTDLGAAVLGNSDNVEIGDWAIAIGNPIGLSYTVTMGIISATDRDIAKPSGIGTYNNLLQTDAAINPGNSGGPLVNSVGEVVGINTLIARESGNGVAIEGINFAISINSVKDVLDQLVETGAVSRGWLGVSVADITPQTAEAFGVDPNQSGALIADVFPGDPADTAGLQAGDVVVRIGDATIASADDLVRTIALLGANVPVQIEALRGDQTMTFDVTLGERPSEQTLATYQGQGAPSDTVSVFGITVGPITPIVAEHLGLNSTDGVVIMSIVADSRGDAAGLAEGDVILEVNRQEITSVEDWNAAVSGLGQNARVSLTVLHQGQLRFVTL